MTPEILIQHDMRSDIIYGPSPFTKLQSSRLSYFSRSDGPLNTNGATTVHLPWWFRRYHQIEIADSDPLSNTKIFFTPDLELASCTPRPRAVACRKRPLHYGSFLEPLLPLLSAEYSRGLLRDLASPFPELLGKVPTSP